MVCLMYFMELVVMGDFFFDELCILTAFTC